MRTDYATDKFWTLVDDGHVHEREHNGYKLRVEKEDSGYRLFVNGAKRGFYDKPKQARGQGIWLAENGNPSWRDDQQDKSFRQTAPLSRRLNSNKLLEQEA